MNEREILKRKIRSETCDTCRFKTELGCIYSTDISHDTKQAEYRDLAEDNTCEDWLKNPGFSSVLLDDIAEAMKKDLDDKILKEIIKGTPGTMSGLQQILKMFGVWTK